MPDQPNQSARDLPEWERHGFASEAEMNQAVYELMNQQAKERIKRRQELYELGYLSVDQLHYNR